MFTSIHLRDSPRRSRWRRCRGPSPKDSCREWPLRWHPTPRGGRAVPWPQPLLPPDCRQRWSWGRRRREARAVRLARARAAARREAAASRGRAGGGGAEQARGEPSVVCGVCAQRAGQRRDAPGCGHKAAQSWGRRRRRCAAVVGWAWAGCMWGWAVGWDGRMAGWLSGSGLLEAARRGKGRGAWAAGWAWCPTRWRSGMGAIRALSRTLGSVSGMHLTLSGCCCCLAHARHACFAWPCARAGCRAHGQ
jgi:hypothetical protein